MNLVYKVISWLQSLLSKFNLYRYASVELCRLRVQRWLKEHRVARARVIKELQREERLEALQAGLYKLNSVYP